MKTWQNLLLMIITSLMIIINSGCSQSPDEKGTCSLTCSNAIIGSRGFSIVPTIDDLAFECSTAGPFPDAVTLNFMVLAESPSGRGDEVIQVPVRNISFQPNVRGGAAHERTHPDLIGPEGRPTPGRFAGVWTRPSEWCSDSCGVISLEVFPYCPPRGQNTSMNVQLQSGPLFSEPMQITIDNPE